MCDNASYFDSWSKAAKAEESRSPVKKGGLSGKSRDRSLWYGWGGAASRSIVAVQGLAISKQGEATIECGLAGCPSLV